MHKAQGFVALREFSKDIKVRRTTREIEEVQGLRLSTWAHGFTPRVDVERVNCTGVLYQTRDMRPRLVARD